MNPDGDIDGGDITAHSKPVHTDDAFGRLDALCRERHWTYRVGHTINARGEISGFILRVHPLDSLPFAVGFKAGRENEAASFILRRLRQVVE
jgi:hypothetical protein